MHLLLVEDDDRLRTLLGRLLSEERHVVDVAATGREALDLATEGRGLDVVILDVGLPDPTGLLKGWSVDRAGSILSAAGVIDWSIDAGGDIRTHGRPAPGASWRVGIQHPLRRDAIAAVVSGTDMAVATSGAYERGDHIVDPLGSGAPGQLLSATVVGPELAFADAYATAAFAMDPDAARWIASIPDYEGGLITSTERVIWTAGMDRYFDQG